MIEKIEVRFPDGKVSMHYNSPELYKDYTLKKIYKIIDRQAKERGHAEPYEIVIKIQKPLTNEKK